MIISFGFVQEKKEDICIVCHINYFSTRDNMRRLFLLLLVTLVLSINNSLCLNNGLALRPPMGYNPWNNFGCVINETIVMSTVDNMVKLGLKDLGYNYFVIDDCWQSKQRDPVTKRLVADPQRFPKGMLALSRYVQSRGMHLGIYSDAGTMTCAKYPGSSGHFELDAITFAEWEIDFVKFDYCYTTEYEEMNPWLYYGDMSRSLNATGRPMIFSLCNWGHQFPWVWGKEFGNMWRTTSDIQGVYARVMENLDRNKILAKYSGPDGWNDPDILTVGATRKGALTREESKSHYALWAIMAAPLFLSNDLTKKPEQWIMDIIANDEVIAIDQDKLGIQGIMIQENVINVNVSDGECIIPVAHSCIRTEVYVKPLEDKGYAVVLFNRGGMHQTDNHFSNEIMSIDWETHLKVSRDQKFKVRDVWAKKDVGVMNSKFVRTQPIQPHDSAMYRLYPINN